MIFYVISLLGLASLHPSLNVQAAEFDPVLMQEIYSYSRPAYCNPELIGNWTCEACERHPKMQEVQVLFNETHEAQGYCGYDAEFDRIVVALRGTITTKNWIQDFDFLMMDYKCDGCKIHQGFHNEYDDLANNLLACVYTLKSNHPTAQTFVTGHSLGAAESVIAALEIQQLITQVDVYYNFGCPRVGNKAFVDYYEKQFPHLYLGRATHWKDIFVHLPTVTMGFHHYGHEIFYDEGFDSYTVCGRDDKECADQFYWPWQWNTKDHVYYYGECAGCTIEQCKKSK